MGNIHDVVVDLQAQITAMSLKIVGLENKLAELDCALKIQAFFAPIIATRIA